MKESLSRREALKTVATAGAGALLSPGLAISQDGSIQVAGRPVEIALTAASSQTLRINLQPIENGQPQPIPEDGSLVRENWGQPAARLRTLFGSRNVKCGDLTVKVSANPLTIRVEAKGGRLIQELKPDAATGNISFPAGDSPLFGLGQGGPQFDRRGQLDQMRSGQGGFQLRTHGSKVPVQLLLGTSGWAMFVHQPMGSFDLTGKDGQVRFASPQLALPLDAFVIADRDPVAVMGEYAKLTGYPELAPLWSFGYQQSHRTLGTPEETMQEAKTFREKQLPCDSMIYLGTDFCPNGWNTHNGEFTWNAKAFPDPQGAINQLHNEHFKVVLHIVIEGRRVAGRVSDPCTAAPLPTGRTPEQHPRSFSAIPTRFVRHRANPSNPTSWIADETIRLHISTNYFSGHSSETVWSLAASKRMERHN